ncbi:hypothetical protein BBP40_008477 [Aspergillus hancockii]|nr:hypothetical protein BBP40_008477 [Aspergillus hancockii]
MAQVIDNFLSSHNLPQPSFDLNSPKAFPVGSEHTDVHAIRHRLIDTTNQLRDLVTCPKDPIKWMIMNVSFPNLVGPPSSTPPTPFVQTTHSPLAYAQSLTSNEIDVARFVRRTAINRIFVEPSPGQVSHTDIQMQAFVAHMSEEAFPASSRIVDALEPSGQVSSSENEGDGTRQMRECYDWASLPPGAKVVDVGGAMGHISLGVAEGFADVEFVVEDQPPLAEQAGQLISSFPEAISKRVKFLAHDFFQPQPAEARAADVYMMRYILHDWSDPYARRILKNLYEAMREDSVLIIADAVMPPAEVLPRCQEEVLRSFDISMLAQLNSQERTREMWTRLVDDSGDGRWKITNVVRPPKGESITILEIKTA